MSSRLWPEIGISMVNPLWFRPLQPGREDVSLTKFEELLEQERRRQVEKGLYLPFYGKIEIGHGDEDDEAEEESEGEDQDDDMDAQPDAGSPPNGAVIVGHDP